MIAGILLIGGYIALSDEASGNSEETFPTGNAAGPFQKVVLGMKDRNYYPREFTVKAGQPVEITLDNTVRGCLRSFAVRDLGVAKYAPTPEDKIVFTPQRTGTFTFSCSMGMGFGKMIVQ